MTLYLKTLMSKIKNCDFKRVIEVVDNQNRFNNDQCKD